jgi:hypothetical protein
MWTWFATPVVRAEPRAAPGCLARVADDEQARLRWQAERPVPSAPERGAPRRGSMPRAARGCGEAPLPLRLSEGSGVISQPEADFLDLATPSSNTFSLPWTRENPKPLSKPTPRLFRLSIHKETSA